MKNNGLWKQYGSGFVGKLLCLLGNKFRKNAGKRSRKHRNFSTLSAIMYVSYRDKVLLFLFYSCIDGYCAMAACPVVSGSGRSPYCWIANGARYLTCGGNHDCTGAANGWGNCYFTSCGFDRAPDPRKEFKKTCDYKNAKMLRDLSNECSAPGYSFDSWVRAYRLTRDIYNKFNPCTGQLIEEAAKKVIKFCYCYNFCGLGQTSNGCEVNGLEGRLDLNKNLYSDYSAR
jgi:hypothetical protein